jgi:hypothetical protein
VETIETSQLLVPLTSQAHKKGLEFAAEQKNVIEGKQVYLNTLAVMAVHQCLQWVGIESDFGECWNPNIRRFSDIADLIIPDWGKLECRPVLPKQQEVIVPTEALESRQGFVTVQFRDRLNYVLMRGFKSLLNFNCLDQGGSKIWKLQEFDPFETLFDYLTPSLLPFNFINVYRNNTTEDVWKNVDNINYLLPKNIPLRIPVAKDPQKLRLFKIIEVKEKETLYKILVSITVTIQDKINRKVSIGLKSLNDQLLPRFLKLHCMDTIQEKTIVSMPCPERNDANQSFDNQKAGHLFEFKMVFPNQIFANKFII